MHIPESLLQEYVVERNFIKPEITMGNYTLKWDEVAYGIPLREVPELKAFLRAVLPYVSGALFKAAQALSATIESEVNDIKLARKIEDSFLPQLLISRRGESYTYLLEMQRDGTSIIKRKEKVMTGEPSDVKQKSSNPFHVEFLLGELVFVR